MPIISYGLDSKALSAGVTKVKSLLGSISDKAGSVTKSIGGMFTPFNTLIAAVGGGMAVKTLVDVGDQYTNMAGQLKYLTGSAESAEAAQKGLYDMSQKTGTSMLSNASSLTRFELASEQTKLSTEENIKVLGGINTLMLQTGVSTQEASAAMMQLGQALASGKLQGDEFRSMSENAPAVMNNLAKSLGMTRAELKAMASEGELTSEILGQAFLKMAEEAGNEELPLTVGRMVTKVVNTLQKLWDTINDRTGILAWIATAFDNLSIWIESNIDLIIEYVLVMRDKFIEAWPSIKDFFYALGNVIVLVAQAFVDAFPYVESFFSGLRNWIGVVEPFITGLYDWVMKLVNAFIKLAQYTPLGVAAGTVASGGGVTDVLANVFNPDSYGNTFESVDVPTSSSGKTVNVIYNGQYSRSDAVNVANDLTKLSSKD